jgi:hypothetical protein
MLPTDGLTVKDLDNLKIKHFPSLVVENEMEVRRGYVKT